MAIAAARKAAVDASTTADEAVSQVSEQNKTQRETEQLSWLPWDSEALQEQRQALAQLQVSKPLLHALAT
jgi:hypothetical protein